MRCGRPHQLGLTESYISLGGILKLKRFITTTAIASAAAFSCAGVASANPAEGVPDNAGFFGPNIVFPSCGEDSATFAINALYVGPGANVRLERKILIEEGAFAWIAVADDGVAAQVNGDAVSGFGRDLQDGHITIEYGDVFEISHTGPANGTTQVYRLQVIMADHEFTEVDSVSATFPKPESCEGDGNLVVTPAV